MLITLSAIFSPASDVTFVGVITSNIEKKCNFVRYHIHKAIMKMILSSYGQ